MEEAEAVVEKQYDPNEDSSDDEADFVRTKNLGTNTENRFYFYEFGATSVPLDDILNDLSKLKSTYNATRKLNGTLHLDSTIDEDDVNYVKPCTKTFSIKDFQKTQMSKKNDATLARFHRYPDPWDSSFDLNSELKKQLYRTPCRDPSGKLIRNLGRDDNRGGIPWKAVEVDRNLPMTTFDSCSESFQVQVVKHMDDVIARVEKEYASAPTKTQAQSNLKASLGADLNNLKHRREQIRVELARAAENNKFHPPSRHKAHK